MNNVYDEVDMSDEDCFEPYEDKYYYGGVPANVTRQELVTIMANGIIRLKQHAQGHYRVRIDDVLDLWFQHDSEGDQQFDTVINEEDFENFVIDVRRLVKTFTRRR